MNNKDDAEQIAKVKAMLRDPLVAQAWSIYAAMEYNKGWNSKSFLIARERAWKTYCHYRDQYMGFAPYNETSSIN